MSKFKSVNQHKDKLKQEYNIKFSQNFFRSKEVSSQVVNLMNINSTDTVIEIGPGKGALTKFILDKCRKLIAVEKDKELFDQLKQDFKDYFNVEFVNENFLNFNLPLNQNYRLVGNIPFALTSDILKKVLTFQNPPAHISFIVQKESALRFLGSDATSFENLFSLRFKPWFEAEIIKEFEREEFIPVPNVDIVLLSIKKRDIPLIDSMNKNEYLDFVTYCFNRPQKSLKYVLKELLTNKQAGIISKQYKIDFGLKPSVIDFNKWLILFNTYQRFVPTDKKTHVKYSYRIHDKLQATFEKSHRTGKAFRNSR